MLKTLTIRNVALIERLSVSFDAGFSALTGETGAGKSIIIEALNFVLGERGSRELIRTDAQKAAVEATFLLSPGEPVFEALEALELEAEDGELVLSRELSLAGKNVCRVNGTLVSAAALKQVGDLLVDIHGQHEHQSLLDARRHLPLLDRFAAGETAPLLEQLGERFAAVRAAGSALREAEMDERERAHRLDLLAYQIRELDAAQLQEGEEEALAEQRRVLQNAQSIMDALETGTACLSGEGGALEPLSAARRAMAGVAQYRADYADVAEKLNDGYYALEDLSYTLRDLRDAFHYDPEELNRIEERLELLSRLKRKYGADTGEMLRYRQKIGEEYELLDTFEQRRGALEQAYDEALAAYTELAQQLSEARRRAAEALRERLLPELRDLGMPHASFSVRLTAFRATRPRRAAWTRRSFCSPPTAASRSSRSRAWRPAGRSRASCWRSSACWRTATASPPSCLTRSTAASAARSAMPLRRSCGRSPAAGRCSASRICRRLPPAHRRNTTCSNRKWMERPCPPSSGSTTKDAAANWPASWAAGRTIRLRCATRASCSTTRRRA